MSDNMNWWCGSCGRSLRHRGEEHYCHGRWSREEEDEAKETTIRGEVLLEARDLTEGDRNDTYGPPTVEYERLAKLWSAYLGIDLTAAQVAICIGLMKINRTIASPDYRDNYVDLAAYAAIAYETTAG